MTASCRDKSSQTSTLPAWFSKSNNFRFTEALASSAYTVVCIIIRDRPSYVILKFHFLRYRQTRRHRRCIGSSNASTAAFTLLPIQYLLTCSFSNLLLYCTAIGFSMV
ncbi:hypothetical protein DENSPDRAFT_560772 [Dentipellis sp. KUC8613]|nr:hypothetical protein DENSPDRAFT_560772 [Dentipellis sp. KUC8613]